MSVARSHVVLAAVLILLAPMAAHASDLRGDEFITTMKDNTLSGTDANGLAYDVYFVPGGEVTYTAVAGEHDSGKWHLDRDGDVCVEWKNPGHALEGCFRMSFDGDKVSWHSKAGSARAELRGEVTDTFLKRAE